MHATVSPTFAYRPCPRCGETQNDTLLGANVKTRTAIYHCRCGCMYSTITARNGLLLNVIEAKR